jgi:hypothetical protein
METVVIPEGCYLALELKNTSTQAHYILTGEGGKSSCLRSPQTDPGYPLPEIAAGVLLAAGLAGLGAFIIVRRRRAARS